MQSIKIADIENDGINLAVDEKSLYIRSMRNIDRFSLERMETEAHACIFKKDGKARTLSVCDRYIFLVDFCDLYILDKETLNIISKLCIGSDLSSDLGTVRFDQSHAHIAMRNGKLVRVDLKTFRYDIYTIGNSSFWDHIVVGDRLYAGTVQGELLEIDTLTFHVIKRRKLYPKNIYSVIHDGRLLYTVSNNRSICAVDQDTFEVVATVKNAVGGMARLLGITNDSLVIADSNKVTLRNKHTLSHESTHDFSTGIFNKGILLHEDTLFGSDSHSIYKMSL